MERGAGIVVETKDLPPSRFYLSNHHSIELIFTFLKLFNIGIECIIFHLLTTSMNEGRYFGGL